MTSPSPVLETPEFQTTPPPSPNQSPLRSRSRSQSRSQSPSRSRSRTPSPRPQTRRRLEETDLPPLPPLPPDGMSPQADGPAATSSDEGPSFREAVQDLAEAGAHGAAKKRTATDADWADFLTALFGFASMLLVWWLVVGRGWSKAERMAYEFTDEEAQAVADPAARIIARSWVNARWGKHILGGADWILMAMVLSEYTERVAPLVRERMKTLPRPQRRTRHGGGRPAETPPPAPPPAQEDRDGELARPVPFGIYPANLT